MILFPQNATFLFANKQELNNFIIKFHGKPSALYRVATFVVNNKTIQN